MKRSFEKPIYIYLTDPVYLGLFHKQPHIFLPSSVLPVHYIFNVFFPLFDDEAKGLAKYKPNHNLEVVSCISYLKLSSYFLLVTCNFFQDRS